MSRLITIQFPNLTKSLLIAFSLTLAPWLASTYIADMYVDITEGYGSDKTGFIIWGFWLIVELVMLVVLTLLNWGLFNIDISNGWYTNHRKLFWASVFASGILLAVSPIALFFYLIGELAMLIIPILPLCWSIAWVVSSQLWPTTQIWNLTKSLIIAFWLTVVPWIGSLCIAAAIIYANEYHSDRTDLWKFWFIRLPVIWVILTLLHWVFFNVQALRSWHENHQKLFWISVLGSGILLAIAPTATLLPGKDCWGWSPNIECLAMFIIPILPFGWSIVWVIVSLLRSGKPLFGSPPPVFKRPV